MSRRWIFLLLFAATCVLVMVAHYVGWTVSSVSDHNIGLDQPIPSDGYHRIVSMAPGITETLFMLGAGSRVAGVTPFCVYPPEAQDKPDVGGFSDPNYEAVLRLNPDIIALYPSHREHARRLDELGLRYIVVDQTSLNDVVSSIRLLGKLTHTEAQAESVMVSLETRINNVRNATAGFDKPTALLVIGRDYASPSLDQVFVAGPGTFLDGILNAAGGVNAIQTSGADYPPLSAEGILRLNPDVIIEFVPDESIIKGDWAAFLAPWHKLPDLRAVQNQRLHVLSGSHVVIPGPRLVQTLEETAALLHPGQVVMKDNTQ